MLVTDSSCLSCASASAGRGVDILHQSVPTHEEVIIGGFMETHSFVGTSQTSYRFQRHLPDNHTSAQ